MTSKHQYLLNRNGRFYARIVVPVHLREAVGRSELRQPLGADHKIALKGLHRAVGQLQDQISTAEAKVAPKKTAVLMQHPLTSQQMAARFYQEIVEDDTQFRDHNPLYSSLGAVNDIVVQQLRNALAGRLDDQSLSDLVGDEIEKRRASGNHDARQGSIEWRQLARDLCVAVYEGLSRTAERDDGDFYRQAPARPAPRLCRARRAPFRRSVRTVGRLCRQPAGQRLHAGWRAAPAARRK